MKSPSARFAVQRKKAGAILIAIQIAVTLAILANALNLIVDRLSWSARLTGIDEANIFYIYATSIDKPPNATAVVKSDLALLRSIPGVVNAYATNSYPLEGGGWSMTVDLQPDQETPSGHISLFFGDEQTLDTLGVKLVAGRNFEPSEIIDRDGDTPPPATPVIITRALEQRLFPTGSALGKSIYTETKDGSTVVGVIDRLQGPFVAATGFMSTFTENTVIAPFRPVGDSSTYVVRSQPGRLSDVLKTAQSKLEGINGSRIISTHPMNEVRAKAYRSNRGLTLILGAIAAILVSVTAFGMAGLTSYWVTERRRQIGIRRALGATRVAILRLFQKENLAITLSGVLAGAILAIALNVWLVGRFEMVRLNSAYVIGSGVAMMLLGQFAILWPALRASQVPPALAIRGS
ncbi:MAG TPA: FtsX-like permease family protein [Steroidobacteraceae bacterium]|nr:FtsX-like permease family protein [Steroidobacteraceae bacterium]